MKNRFLNRFLLAAVLLASLLATSQASLAATSVFINEIHYDNVGTDSGEFIEIAGPAGTDLTGWSLVLYNGSGGAAYNTIDLSLETIPDQGNGYGTFAISFPANGIQNGAPDGLALIDNGGTVIQFLSYEGSFTASGGPADGLNSTDIGVAEDGGTAVGFSLQLAGTGAMYEDFTWSGPIAQTVAAVNTGQTFVGSPSGPTININEIHYDNSGTDVGEFVEIAGTAGADLTDWSLVLYNGSNGSVYNTIDLSSATIPDQDAGIGTFVFDLPTNGIQNGSPDGLALVDDGNNVIEFLSYEGSFTATDGPANGLTSTDIGVSEPGSTPLGESLQLINGIWVGPIPATPRAINAIPTPTPSLVINEIDYDQASTDTAEFVEIKNTGSNPVNLDNYSLQFINGSNTSLYDTIDLPDFELAADDYFVVCANAATTPNCDLDDGPDTNFIQNGAPDAVALLLNTDIVDTVSYEGDTTGFTETAGATTDNPSVNFAGLSRLPDGTDTDDNSADFGFSCITPGATNTSTSSDCADPNQSLSILINEVDADTPSTDTAEFVELFGDANAALDGLVVVFFNGSSDTAYNAFDLDGFSTDTNGYFVLGNSGVANVSVTFSSNGLQNGADAVALYEGNAADFPSGTALTTNNLIDAIVYDTNDGDDAGLLALLNAGQPQVDEAGGGDKDNDSNQRCANGTGGTRNTNTYAQFAPTPGAENTCGITPPPAEACGDAVTLISAIQGNGFDSPLLGTTVSVEGIVVGDFQDTVGTNGDLNGFFVQEEDADSDGDPATSEGIFVFQGSNPTVDVNIGDQVRVSGTADEFFDMTQIDELTFLDVCSSGNSLPTVTPVTLPISSDADLEQVEGMYVTFPQTLTISEYFNFDRFNEIVLTVDRPFQPTAIYEPGSQDAADLADLNARSRITLDDGRTVQNPDPAIHPNGQAFTLSNTFRGGDTVQNATGVLNYAFDLYRIQPTQGATYTAANTRPAAPTDVGGSITVASFNVLNYFNTIDDGSNNCGANQNLECRGADNEAERIRQLDKIVAAMLGMEADIFGIIEVENTPGVEAMDDIIAGLNAQSGANTYDYIDTGIIGTDAIKVGFIYNTTTVTPVGNFAILDSSVDPRFIDTKNRPVLAQTFEEIATGAQFTAAVNHFKSKGSPCDDVGDPNSNDGSGNCNGTRTDAAVALVDWLNTDPTGSNDPDFLIIGDLNAYDKEDPIDALTAAGYTDLAFAFNGEFAYSYVFSGQFGYLDYALANQALLSQVTGATEWHINADEPDILDYDTTFNLAGFYENNAFRASDHDPIIVGLNLDAPVSNVDIEVTITDSPDPLVAGENGGVDNLVHVITVKNNGPEIATNIIIEFGANTNPPPSLSFSKGSQGPAGNQWTIPSLNSGESATLTFTFDIGEDYPLPNVSSSASLVSVDQTDTNSGNDSAAEDTTVTPPPPPGPAVVSFTLIDAKTNQPIAGFDPIPEGGTIDLSQMPTNRFNIRANVEGDVESVIFDGSVRRTENVAPYAAYGDRNGNYRQQRLNPGGYTIEAVPYTEDRGNGTAGTGLTINFTVIEGDDNPPPPPSFAVVSFTLIDADTDQPIGEFDTIPANAVIDLATLPTTNLNIRANVVNGDQIESVRFTGDFSRVENVAPYALFGDRSGDYYRKQIAPGTYTITAEPFSRNRAQGTGGGSFTLTFTIINSDA